MKIQFDIKFKPQIENGEYKVVTTKEQLVRIICWDRSTTYWKIVALVLAPDGKTENPFTYDVNGKESDGCLHNHELDLFIITPEPELSKFEQAYMRIVHKMKPEEFNDDGLKTAKENAKELLDLARKELEGDLKEKVIHDYWKQASDQCAQAREEGRKEALKDLPRWRKCADCTPKPKYSNESIFSIDSENVTRESAIVHKGYFLPLDGLEKLPGFKEDEK